MLDGRLVNLTDLPDHFYNELSLEEANKSYGKYFNLKEYEEYQRNKNKREV